MRIIFPLVLASLAVPSWASPWQFDSPFAVASAHGKNIFHHLEGAGRKNIAVSGDWVAVTWEDNRKGQSRCYVAFKAMSSKTFSRDMQVSGKGECFEPVIAGAGSGRFVVGGEENGRVKVRLVSAKTMGPLIKLGGDESGQLTLAQGNSNGQIVAAWSQKAGNFMGVQFTSVNVAGNDLKAGKSVAVDSAPVIADQQYPSIAVTDNGVAVAWEDRRLGHTIIMAANVSAGLSFSPPIRINETARGQVNMMKFGRGTGSARVALAVAGKNRIIAVWSDKRDFLSGYDVYGAWSDDDGKTFGKNQKVQDSFGDSIAQWHPAVAANRSGTVAVVWDDDRDGTSDIWLSWPMESGWSDNIAIPGASGPGIQNNPAITLDDAGNLHVAWVTKDDPNGATQIFYVLGHHTEK